MSNTTYDNSNRGVLFSNREGKAQNQNAPDYKGQINCDGVEFWLSAWIKEGQKGKFMSISVTPKDAAPAPQRQAPQRPAQQPQRQQQPQGKPLADMDDDIPF